MICYILHSTFTNTFEESGYYKVCLSVIKIGKLENGEDFEDYKDDPSCEIQFFTTPRIGDQGVGFKQTSIFWRILRDYLKDGILWECEMI